MDHSLVGLSYIATYIATNNLAIQNKNDEQVVAPIELYI
jgi:hypothetical protein